MNRYLPSEKLSDEYLASERDRLRKTVFSLFENPFEEEIRALEKIHDRYEQLKECVRLQDKMQKYVASEENPKEIALQFLTIAEFDNAAFNCYFEEHSEYTVITLYELAKDFFESIIKGKREWNQYRFKELSNKSISEISEISKKFFANYPEWVKYVVRIEASKLSTKDKFMQYSPKNDYEKIFKSHLTAVIRNGISDFYCFNTKLRLDSKDNICFDGMYSVAKKSYNWWYEKAEMFSPICKSRLGRKSEYIAFLGVLMKTLIDEGLQVKAVWNAICNDHLALQCNYSSNYWGAHYNLSCELSTFFFTSKLLAADFDESGFWITDSWHRYNSVPADIYHSYRYTDSFTNSLGWIVFPDLQSIFQKVEVTREMLNY